MKPRYGVKVFVLSLVVLIVTAGWALASETTLIGEVNDNYQIVADGQIYEIADTQKGNELVDNYVSYRVEVTGSVEEIDDVKVLTVVSYKLLGD